MNIMKIESIQDAITFVHNSGFFLDWEWGGNTSADGFAHWIRAHYDEIDGDNYHDELRAYLLSEGEDPSEYSFDSR